MRSSSTETTSDTLRAELLQRYRRNRARTRAIFSLLSDAAYYQQPIAQRHPIVFYEGHLPGFSFNTLVKKALGRPSIDARLETLFARGIDPHETASSGQQATGDAAQAASHEARWPSRDVVRAFAEEADRQILDVLEREELDRPGHPLLDRAEAVFAILEHEAMHQETLLYRWHRLPFTQKHKPAGYRPRTEGVAPRQEWIEIPAGCATLGVSRDAIPFGWDNEFAATSEMVAPFAIERYDVTNARYLEYMEATGAAHPLFWEQHDGRWFWRGMFDLVPLPLFWPVYVSHEEASAFARWSGARLPTEAEFQRAAYGSLQGERVHPWGSAAPASTHNVFDFATWDPEPVGTHPMGASAWGVEDLIGNGWEWTSTVFAPFPGFRSMASYPEYSADFFDGEHFVMKGASPATARGLLRPTFRNWFRARYPYVYATFRCAKDHRG